ncbi:hypothetical protein PENANT_c233G02792 [Penicillium antarcticum]|uniref:Uncharacterized protein n=1 Tax=Penicillium antarcticum TaxID=416450 RepID=A0A1V6P6Q7_9EURO|nr:hypothetical protein PENANT_c261G11804 [Penicillium antarcticum]OQD72680.1 hypothetical protein PENANT_c233G02792 [Penicillium antarcticum]
MPYNPAFLVNVAAFQAYLRERPKNLPPFEKDSDGNSILHTGERWCRVENCSSGHRLFADTGSLRVHVLKAHNKTMKLKEAPRKSRHTMEEEQEIIAWFMNIGKLPRLPLTKSNTVSVKAVKEHLKDRHLLYPCSACKAKNLTCPKTPFVCKYLERYFDVVADFDPPVDDNEDEDDYEDEDDEDEDNDQ